MAIPLNHGHDKLHVRVRVSIVPDLRKAANRSLRLPRFQVSNFFPDTVEFLLNRERFKAAER